MQPTTTYIIYDIKKTDFAITTNITNKLSSPTIQQLVDEHKVVLDVLLADLAKVGCHDVTHFVEELEHHGGVDILLGDGRQPDVGALDMEEAGAGDVGDRGPNLLPGMNHVHTERIHRIPPEMEGRVTKRARDIYVGC